MGNVMVRTNVLCKRLYNPDQTLTAEISEQEIHRRLMYWELREYVRTKRMGSYLNYRSEVLTERQLVERDAFIKPRQRVLWQDAHDFTPMPPTTGLVPFFKQPSGLQRIPVHYESATTTLEPPNRVPKKLPLERDEPDLDEQIEVIQAPIEARLLVLAPPGTGKTHTLIERISYLIESDAVSTPADEIVVLSFTRAAVSEVVQRIGQRAQQGWQDDIRYVDVRTFDSFATRMLLQDLDPGTLPNSGYDVRIRLFCELLDKGELPVCEDIISSIRCLMVDEVQDLTSYRAKMVLQLIKRVVANGGGVVLLGDPAQAIYDWQDGDSNVEDSTEFLSSARMLLGDTLREISLTKFHRYSPVMAELVGGARRAMGDDGLQPNGVALRQLLHDCGPTKDLRSLKDLVQDSSMAAVLTRTNMEAFQLARWCKDNDVPHRMKRGARSEFWPGWLAALTLGFKSRTMRYETAAARWERYVAPCQTSSFDDAWKFLMDEGVADDYSFGPRGCELRRSHS